VKQREEPWNQKFQLLLTATVAINLLPQITEVPNWTVLIAALCIVWKLLHLTKGWRLPPKILLWPASIAGGGAVVFEYGMTIGPEAGCALLVFLSAAKLLETNRQRDAAICICISFFLLMAHLLNSQSIGTSFFLFIDLVGLTLLMYEMNRGKNGYQKIAIWPILRLTGVVLPLWAFLFFAFPRFSMGLLNYQAAPQGKTGFSDRLNPGSVARVVQSDAIAFRAEFERDSHVNPDMLYWRNAVLDHGDGLVWTRTAAQPDAYVTKPVNKPIVSYRLWLEPTLGRDLVSLEYAYNVRVLDADARTRIRRMSDRTYRSVNPIASPLHVAATSVLSPDQEMLPKAARTRSLELSNRTDSEVLKLLESIYSRHGLSSFKSLTALQKNEILLDWLAKQNFVYTLSPKPLKKGTGFEQFKDFLFRTRSGFCEHYAATYATLLRYVGVPARVVIGYQGGEPNEFGNYLIIRALEAHAWVEYWSDNDNEPKTGRWIRVDPTSVVAPMRLQLGGEFNRLDQGLLSAGVSADELRRRVYGSMDFVYRATMAWDAAQMKWQNFLFNYDFSLQQAYLSELGFHSKAVWVLLIIVAIGLVLFALLLVFTIRRNAKPRDPIAELWFKLTQLGPLARNPSEGPLRYAERIQTEQPMAANLVAVISKEFIELRYSDKFSDTFSDTIRVDQKDAAKRLRRLIDQLSKLSRSRAVASSSVKTSR
jgi:hypothetical protein